jgi:hypothetical protein
MIRQVIQGGGNMPAYGKKLSPAEVEALVAFMQTLSPRSKHPAVPSDKRENKLPRDVAAMLPPRTTGLNRPVRSMRLPGVKLKQ